MDINSLNGILDSPVLESNIEQKVEAIEMLEKKVFVTPEMYGAVGDGETDDSVAINTALSNAAGKILLLNGKQYKISQMIRPSSNTTIIGGGAKFIGASNSNYGIFISGKENIYIKGIEFTNLRRAIDIRNCNNIEIVDAYAHDMYRNASEFEDNYMLVFNNSNYIRVQNIRYYNDNLNSDCIRLKENCNHIYCKDIYGYCADAFLVLVTDEGTLASSISDVTFDNVRLTSENYCGIQVEIRRAESLISDVTFTNCILSGSKQGEPIRLANSTSGYHSSSNETGNIKNFSFDNCTFVLGSTSDGSRPFARINTLNIDTIKFNNCTFIDEYNSESATNFSAVEVDYCNIKNMLFNNCSYLDGYKKYMFDFKANNQEVSCNINNIGFKGKNTPMCQLACASNLTVSNCNVEDTSNIVSVVSGTFVSNISVFGNIGQATTVYSNNNNCTITGGNNISSDNLDVTGKAKRLLGMLKASISPNSANCGDFYIYVNSNASKLKIYSNGSWV